MQNQNNFNVIAPFYDGLSRLVFGSIIKNAQIESLSFIPPHSAILIAGGGTGWILDEIARVIPSGLTITYLDKSSEMIELSKRRNMGYNKIAFICDALEDTLLPQQEYNVIITPFFLDCFSQETFEAISKKLDLSLKNGGIWIYVDFYLSAKSKFWQRITVKIMYAFFRLLCQIQANRLPEIDAFFSKFSLVNEQTYCHNFIRSQVFRRMI